MKTWDETFSKILDDIAEHSHCCKVKVSALIVKNNRIISTGLNGTIPGSMNCDEHFYIDVFANPKHEFSKKYKDTEWDDVVKTEDFKTEHHHWSAIHEFHAEENAIFNALKNGINLDGATIYIKLSPCFNCAKQIVLSGITRVVYEKEYEWDIEGLNFLVLNNIVCSKLGE